MQLGRTALVTAVVAALLAIPTVASADMHPTPGAGPAFGRHVAQMAPEHARDHGALFGQCVSAMASTGECPHHQ